MGVPSSGKDKRHPVKSLVSGGIAGGVEIVCMYPTEFCKTLLQLDSKLGAERRYKGSFDVVKQTIGQHGFRGLYRGMGSLLYGSVPKSAVRFGTYDLLRNTLMDSKGELSRTNTLLAGLGAGVAEAILIVTPMETIKVKLVHDLSRDVPKYKPGLGGIIQVMQQEGIQGCYKGLGPTVLKQGSNQMIRFFVFGELKGLLQGGDPKKDIGSVATALCGAAAGAASVFGNTPIDVVKSRMQGLDSAKYKNSWDCVKAIAREEGFVGFYKGTVPRLGRVCGDVALVFTLVDLINKALDAVWDTSDYK
ncbi:Mitochondrial carrier protein [Plasmodiophora brassicae]|uniref:Uncharacterized protein n=1 Tax=Plasmodiophora brassicae TaxID=37360 RepID=A0A0G4J013_PLABS|nr:hypothetical protein PBRA_001663 [Plasmodiophora brassicae]SPQ93898.1 unnamed protein product [Plasmodiophora brassicae]